MLDFAYQLTEICEQMQLAIEAIEQEQREYVKGCDLDEYEGLIKESDEEYYGVLEDELNAYETACEYLKMAVRTLEEV